MNLHKMAPEIPLLCLQFSDAWQDVGNEHDHPLWYHPESGTFGYFWRARRDSAHIITNNTILQWARDHSHRHHFTGEPTENAAGHIEILRELPTSAY